MKYFGRALSICSLITATTISHLQRNQAFVPEYYGDFAFPKLFLKTTNATVTKSKGGERWQLTRWVEILCRVCQEEEEEKVPRNSKKLRRNRDQMWGELDPALIRLTLLSFVGAFTSSSSFSLLANSSNLTSTLFAWCKCLLSNKWQRWENNNTQAK